MTRGQKQVYDFIRAYWSEHGYGPSYREMAEAACAGGVKTAYVRVRALEEQDKVRVIRHRRRGIIPVYPRAA